MKYVRHVSVFSPRTAYRQLSIIIPFHNEEDNVSPVLTEVAQLHPEAEIIAVDDGSTDSTAARIAEFAFTRLVRMPRHLGQSAALYAGLTRATGRICVIMDGDGQNDPADIDRLVATLDHADVACGYRVSRRDTWLRRVSSRVANGIRQFVLKDGIRDTGCSLKAMRREHVDCLVPFDGMHRFLPAFLRCAGLHLVEIPVNHRPRTRGVSKYTIRRRAWRGLFDLLGVRWLISRQAGFCELSEPDAVTSAATTEGREIDHAHTFV